MAREKERLPEMLLHGFGVVNGHSRIEIVDLTAYRAGDAGRIALKVDDQLISEKGRVAPRALCEGTEENVSSVLAHGS